jgi:hypothetical protein
LRPNYRQWALDFGHLDDHHDHCQEEKMSKKMGFRSISSTFLVVALLLVGSVAIASDAGAVTGKQGTTCAKAGSKVTTNKISYTCGTNPTTTSTNLVWILGECVTADKSYQSASGDYDKYLTSSTAVLAQLQATLASYQNALTVAQDAQAASATKVYTIGTDPKTKLPVTVVGITAAISAVQAKIVSDQASLSAAKDAASQREWNNAIRSRTSALNIMNRQVTSIANHITQDQSQIATFTAQLASSQNSQTQLLAQLKRTLTNAKTTRSLACKSGR